MIAVDTNILVYAHREDSAFHAQADLRITKLAEESSSWALPWPCLQEFVAIVTNPRIFATPTPLVKALDQVDAWIASPSLVLLSEQDQYWPHLRDMLATSKVTGGRVHDARIAALCRQHGVRELWSADRDFGRFPMLRVVNPLIV